MTIDPDATPPAGFLLSDIPDEPPTEPDLQWVTCPACRGKPLELEVSWNDNGTMHRGHARHTCDVCRGFPISGKVDRGTYERWVAEHGRPAAKA